ncbi:hypothetical protein CPC08DRAFT_703886 [Agrocybe pediades]|nr:hypothetical protein CPC08DRAFT_703886 [Agrocybe pediades]
MKARGMVIPSSVSPASSPIPGSPVRTDDGSVTEEDSQAIVIHENGKTFYMPRPPTPKQSKRVESPVSPVLNPNRGSPTPTDNGSVTEEDSQAIVVHENGKTFYIPRPPTPKQFKHGIPRVDEATSDGQDPDKTVTGTAPGSVAFPRQFLCSAPDAPKKLQISTSQERAEEGDDEVEYASPPLAEKEFREMFMNPHSQVPWTQSDAAGSPIEVRDALTPPEGSEPLRTLAGTFPRVLLCPADVPEQTRIPFGSKISAPIDLNEPQASERPACQTCTASIKARQQLLPKIRKHTRRLQELNAQMDTLLDVYGGLAQRREKIPRPFR